MLPDGALLEARAINAWRGDNPLLRDVSFGVRAGEFLQVTGPNGVGKTTLLRIVCGLLPPESGEIAWRGSVVSGPSSALCDELSYLGHQNAVKADLSVLENLRYLCGLRTPIDERTCTAALERVGLATRAKLPARALSAGQKRRLALARLTIDPPALWVLDEPATNLDADGTRLVESMIADQLGRGGVVIAAAHLRLLGADARTRTLELA
jgi:heme exporter protein A